MASTAPGSCPAATSALIALLISARRPDDMPTSSGLTRDRGSAACAASEMQRMPETMNAETAFDVLMGVLLCMVKGGADGTARICFLHTARRRHQRHRRFAGLRHVPLTARG